MSKQFTIVGIRIIRTVVIYLTFICTNYVLVAVKDDLNLLKFLRSSLILAALQSVFPQTELSTFMSMNKRDKERQLQELTMIVTGIRLFNKECGKGGEGIDDCMYSISMTLL